MPTTVLEDLASVLARFTPGAQLSVAAFIVCALWCFFLCIYRLYFHPLAHFPGDRLAAITGWVETYHDVFRGGQFIFTIEKWHAKYGPIVRINPWEVHVADPRFVDVLFAGNSKFDKKIEWKYRFGIPHSSFDTIEHQHHRIRRAAASQFFSKQKIAGITGYISEKVQRFCDRIEEEHKRPGYVVDMTQCLTALTFDIITYYTFARSFEYTERPGFEGPFTEAPKKLAATIHMMGHFPYLLAIFQSIPRSVSAAMNPAMAGVLAFQDEIEDQIKSIISGGNNSYKDVGHKTVFRELLMSDLPSEEKDVERLKHEACSIVMAGVETTAAALSKAIFYILDNQCIKMKLSAELEQVFPNPRSTPPLETLEALPYLSSTVNEVLRMTIGVSQRTIRKSRTGPVPYGEYLIPQGYYFSMTTYFTHNDPTIWESPEEFRPERWLEGKKTPLAPDGQPLSKYLVTFGRGPRMCIGLNLARAELFIGLAVLFRRFNFELFDTTREAVDMKADYFLPLPSPTSKGVRVLVK